jgi:hypothetical protein
MNACAHSFLFACQMVVVGIGYPTTLDIKQIQAQMGNTGIQPGESDAFARMLAQYSGGNPYASKGK